MRIIDIAEKYNVNVTCMYDKDKRITELTGNKKDIQKFHIEIVENKICYNNDLEYIANELYDQKYLTYVQIQQSKHFID